MDRIALGDVEVDLAGRRVSGPAGATRLTTLEAGVLGYLLERPDTDVPRDELLVAVWGYSPRARSRAVDVVVSRLRQKLGDELRERLLTSHGVGYRLVMGQQPARAEPTPGRAWVRLPGGRLDLDQRRFVPDEGAPVELSLQEATVVELLVATRGFVERERLARAVWSHVTPHVLQALLQRLRRKLGPALVARRGLGVQLLREEPRTQLPPSPNPFFARPELDEVRAALAGSRAVVLRGPAGVGKSRLALELGHRLLVDDPGVELWWVPLSGALGPGSFLHGVAGALGVELAGPDPAGQLGRALRARPRTVLVLDNLEQLVDQAPILAAWLAEAPRVRFLLTSRCSLPIPAVEVTLRPLPLATALALFAARAAAFPWVAPEPAQVERVVARLDGLPLAIELAAARVEQLDQLAQALDRRLDLLGQGGSTLRGALDWSWGLLGEPEREALAELSLFRGGIPRTLAGELRTLRDHCLVHETPDGFVLTDTVRLYARERLAQRPDRELRVCRWAERLLDHARAANDRCGHAGTHRAALRELRAVRDDLWDLATSAPTLALRARAADEVYDLLRYEEPPSDGVAFWRAHVALGTSCHGELRLGEALLHEQDYEGALRGVALARELAREPADLIDVLRISASVHREVGRRDRSLAELQQARALARAHRLERDETLCCIDLTTLHKELGELGPGLAVCRDAEALARAAGRLDLLQGTLEKRALLLLVFEAWDDASGVAREAADLATELDSRHRLARTWCMQALARRGRGELALADQLFAQAEAELEALGCTERQIPWNRGLVALERGDHQAAEQWFAQAAALHAAPEDSVLVAYSVYRAVASLIAGEPGRAVDQLRALEPSFLRLASTHSHSTFLGWFAVAAALDGRDEAEALLTRARLASSPRPSTGVFLRWIETWLTGDRQALAEQIGSAPRGEQHLELLLRVLEGATRRAPGGPRSSGTGGRR